MRKVRIVLIIVLAGLLLLGMTSGQFLVLNRPQPADVIVVLAGETDYRPELGLKLLSENYAPKMILDVPGEAKKYDRTILEIAHDYVEHLPQKNSITICPVFGLSTKAETGDVAKCLKGWNVHNVLLVTSDFHTRRALDIFKHEFPEYRFSVAASSDPQQFGVHWWEHRQWAKLNFDEWLRLLWWEAIDRWQ